MAQSHIALPTASYNQPCWYCCLQLCYTAQTQAESIQRREELLQEMERENLMTARETRTVQESQVRRAKEIESQVVSLMISVTGMFDI